MDDDVLNPWGAPAESHMSSALVSTLLTAVSAGAQVLALMPGDNKGRAVRVEKLWSLFSVAESMLLKELGRGRRLAAQRDAEVADLLNRPLVEDDDGEDDFDDFGNNSSSF